MYLRYRIPPHLICVATLPGKFKQFKITAEQLSILLLNEYISVSYTHLTLPTIYSV